MHGTVYRENRNPVNRFCKESMMLPSYFSIPDTFDCAQLKTQAEELFTSGQFYCSEIVVKMIRDIFCPSVSDEIIAAASGCPVGMDDGGCTCGAVAGGVMALGLIFGRTRPEEKVQDRFHTITVKTILLSSPLQ